MGRQDTLTISAINLDWQSHFKKLTLIMAIVTGRHPLKCQHCGKTG